MYLLIPSLLILASAIGILVIIWRKLPRLKELAETESSLTAAENSNGIPAGGWRTFIRELCPEIWSWIKSIRVKEYKEMWLVETEKLLRRLRVVSMKMDRFSDTLIKKIRKQTFSGSEAAFPGAETSISEQKQETETQPKPKMDGKTELKKNEQRLIIEIAKNPKSPSLYEELGDLYVRMGDNIDAKESYEAAIELNSKNEELKNKLSSVLEQLNKPEDSQK